MKTICNSILVLAALIIGHAAMAQGNKPKPTIIFVHGVFADGSCWNSQLSALQTKGYPVISVQNPLTSLTADVAATKRAIGQAKGDVILVGHSWGGFVITQAGNDPKVKGLVYVAAAAPDAGESIDVLFKKAPPTELDKYLVKYDGFLWLSKDGIKNGFAQDLSPAQQELIYATQGPAPASVFMVKSGKPAWKTKKSWYIVAQNDRTMSPVLERLLAKKIKAKTTELPASHLAMIAKADEVTRVIEDAASNY
ncbi:Pimeloyl-ACP methyl ester carboxylesterase [Pedobacter westerhofensis]|uniref:Pimeloyl-ACP methyl ester carboxylesterase n=1 Tax=Pedobacter westerhofensis TaxID=425512 RepID=A0A521FKP6_9SPHI|nr:alpha/beta hydrolase [Pedobacter westerhofensis]SMO96792.1 Pimeloyl-ACP methyl ester carboxylesterase [Pedobacter westerhofensis]